MSRGRGRGHMVVEFTTTCATSPYHHWSCEFEPRSWCGVLDTTLCVIVCQWLATGRWCSPGTPVFSTNKTDRHNITEILSKVALNTTNQPTDCKLHIKYINYDILIRLLKLLYLYHNRHGRQNGRCVGCNPTLLPKKKKKKFETQLSNKYNMPYLIMIHCKCDFVLLTQQE